MISPSDDSSNLSLLPTSRKQGHEGRNQTKTTSLQTQTSLEERAKEEEPI